MDVRTLCLGVLAERPMTGYEIKKTFEGAFRHFFLAGFGSIYPALAELASTGSVRVESVEDKRHGKKVYRITPRGRDHLAAALAAARPQHKVRSEFLVLLYFAHLLPPERLHAVLADMARQWERTLTDLAAVERRSAELTPGQRFTLGFGQTVLGAALDYTRAHGPSVPAAAAAPRAAE